MATNQELKEQQRRQWSANASSWDGMHERLEREMAAVTEWLCRETWLAPGMHVLDLACGSGHPAINIARLVQPGGDVIATDLAPEMVEVTRRRVAEAGLTNVGVQTTDLEQIEFPDASFDAATCRFGVMFCPQPAKALAEVRRVLKPGGRFALAVWDTPDKSPAQTLIGEALERFGKPQPPVDFAAPGVYQLAPPGKLARLLSEAGFSDVRVESLPLTMEYESVDALWQRRLGAPGSLRGTVAQLSESELAQLKQVFAEVLKPYWEAGSIRLRQTPLCAAATR